MVIAEVVYTSVASLGGQRIESVMLSNDKLFVVLAVVLIIWIGVALFILVTDRKLDRLEAALKDREEQKASAG